MKKYLEIFFTFFKIGAFTLGGGYAMIPLIEKEVVNNKNWIDQEEFLDMLTLAQSSPGPIAVNVAVYVGYKVGKIKGCISTVLGSIMPSFLIILAIASIFTNFQNNLYVQKAFKGIRPAVVSLIAVPVINMIKKASSPKPYIVIAFIVMILVSIFNITPIIVIIIAAIVGITYFKFTEVNEK